MTIKEQQILYFSSILAFANKAQVRELLVKLGYTISENDITPEMCIDALQLYGKEFAKPFKRIARAALESPKMDAIKNEILKNSKLSRADGSLSDKDKLQAALDFLNWGTGTLDSLGLSSLWDENKGKYADAALLQAQANLLAANQLNSVQNNKNSLLWIGLAVGVVLLIIIIIAVVARKK